MASVSKAQALLLSHPQVLGAYVVNNPTDQLLPRLPKIAVRGDSLQVTQVDVLATAAFITSGGNADASETTYVTPARKFDLRRMATKVEVTGEVAQNVSMVNDVFQQQIEAKMLAMWNTVGEKLIYGTGVDPEPAGLQALSGEYAAGVLQPAAGAGTPFALQDLDRLIETVFPWDGGLPRAFVMNRLQYRRFAGLCHAAGFTPATLPDPILGAPLLHYLGVPILVSDFILNTETANTTSIYLVVLGPRDDEPQLGGLVWFYNEDTGAGIRVDGPHRTSGAADMLYSDLELNMGFATLGVGSVARLKDIQP